ncbi:GGDEF domain-containing protein [Methylophilus medardicus]|uniref:diguanylate cyclase n=1 Tax=Methylophilus medardicus TaxID=2588534 RepID=A0A5B8CUJ9_9PROT|nr:sensor domain-containing diguanylate cyclase [Methylophilus medardicus]QDC44929.1 sensor domain-containing diguanylate cyclase [Methylophilus medardicus]QDC49936.1 sensor domain-containing diguanylate cyclase [Methylophilus medardicus]QDC53641.1 sensor domain-containing diguanylate cyclase [Methylophilus medardicus]
MDHSLPNDENIYKTLLESTQAIPWKIDWATKQFTYIGPQIESLLGWAPSTWQTVDDWVSRIHEEDRARILNFCVEQSLLGLDHEADYRALTADGNFVWIRDVVHVIRASNGEPEALVGFMFDISERKKTDEKLQLLQMQLEEFSYQDGLTGVANRRMLDRILEREWLNAKQRQQPLALIMMDIDYFKQFNDFYGHLRGDEVLKQVAEILSHTGVRGRDFFARFGGEEFVLVLPEAPLNAARRIAERCRQLIFKAQIPHEQSEISHILTISMGVGSIIPNASDDLQHFIDSVDQLMYEAKHQGRNRIASPSAQRAN